MLFHGKKNCPNCLQAEQNGAEQLFCQPSVFVHPKGVHNDGIGGYISIVFQKDDFNSSSKGEIILTWIPYYMLSNTEEEPVFVNISSNSPQDEVSVSSVGEATHNADLYSICLPLGELKSIRRYLPSLLGFSVPYIILQSRGGIAFPPLYFHEGGVRKFFATVTRYCQLTKDAADPSVYVVNDTSSALARSLQSLDLENNSSNRLVSSISHGISRATQLGWQWWNAEQPDESLADGSRRPAPLEHKTTLGSFEILESSQASDRKRRPVGAEEWSQAFSEEGRVLDPERMKEAIFFGGLEPGIRIEAWKFLLGYFPWDSTYEERAKLRDAKRKEYFQYKGQWTSITVEQAKHFRKFVERNHMIEKDVVRTDRNVPYFEKEDSPALKMLHDVLLTYVFFNFDLGYVQGMNDLLSPILVVMEDEADSFWCFKHLMDKMAPNFHKDQNGMHTQLLQISNLLHYVCPKFHRYLEKLDCLNMFYCYRWVLLRFKREFKFLEIMDLWEVLWTDNYTPQFHLFLAVGILMKYKEHIMKNLKEFDEILRFINSLSESLNVTEVIEEGEKVFRKFMKENSNEEEKLMNTGIGVLRS